jgi:WD40 repeat protein
VDSGLIGWRLDRGAQHAYFADDHTVWLARSTGLTGWEVARWSLGAGVEVVATGDGVIGSFAMAGDRFAVVENRAWFPQHDPMLRVWRTDGSPVLSWAWSPIATDRALALDGNQLAVNTLDRYVVMLGLSDAPDSPLCSEGDLGIAGLARCSADTDAHTAELFALPQPTAGVDLMFHESTLLLAAEGTDARTWERLHLDLELDTGWVEQTVWNPTHTLPSGVEDGALLDARADHRFVLTDDLGDHARVHDLETGTWWPVDTTEARVVDFAALPSRGLIAVATEPWMRAVEGAQSSPQLALYTTDGTLVRRIGSDAPRVMGVAFHPDGGQLVAATWDKRLLRWNLAEGVLDAEAWLSSPPSFDALEVIEAGPMKDAVLSGNVMSFDMSIPSRPDGTVPGPVMATVNDVETHGERLVFTGIRGGKGFVRDTSRPGQTDLPLIPRSVAIAGETLVVAGEPEEETGTTLVGVRDGEVAWRADAGALWAVVSANGVAHTLSFDGAVVSWEAGTGKRLRELRLPHGGGGSGLGLAGDELLAASGEGYLVRLSAADLSVLSTTRPHLRPVLSLDVHPRGHRIATASRDGTVRILDTKGETTAVLLSLWGEHAIVTPAGHYVGSSGALNHLAVRDDNGSSATAASGHAIGRVDQYGGAMNRPDRVLQALGVADDAVLSALRTAAESRASTGRSSEVIRLGRVSARTEDPTARIGVRDLAAGSEARVWVNGVPVEVEATPGSVTVALSGGDNFIEVAALHAGQLGPRRGVHVTRTTPGTPRTFVVAMGVSDYGGDADLPLATTDAAEVAAWFEARGAEVELMRNDIDLERARAHLARAGVDDIAVVFVAGHGLLAADGTFVWATGADALADASKGVGYAQLDALLQATPARKRLLLMDSCHAGPKAIVPPIRSERVRALPVALPRSAPLVQSVAPTRQRTLDFLFGQLERGTGAVVIGASAATGVAYESKRWGNGVFTFAVLSGLESGAADLDGDGAVQATELSAYVAGQVVRLTDGAQQPMLRANNAIGDFDVVTLGVPRTERGLPPDERPPKRGWTPVGELEFVDLDEGEGLSAAIEDVVTFDVTFRTADGRTLASTRAMAEPRHTILGAGRSPYLQALVGMRGGGSRVVRGSGVRVDVPFAKQPDEPVVVQLDVVRVE